MEIVMIKYLLEIEGRALVWGMMRNAKGSQLTYLQGKNHQGMWGLAMTLNIEIGEWPLVIEEMSDVLLTQVEVNMIWNEHVDMKWQKVDQVEASRVMPILEQWLIG